MAILNVERYAIESDRSSYLSAGVSLPGANAKSAGEYCWLAQLTLYSNQKKKKHYKIADRDALLIMFYYSN